MNWLVDKFKQMEKAIMTDVSSVENVGTDVQAKVDAAIAAGPTAVPEVPKDTVTVKVDGPTPDAVTQLAELLKPQISAIVQTAIADAVKGNFSGIISDTKTAAVNYALQDAVSAGKALEQMVYNHISTLGVSKELDIAKGKITDAFMWIEKHLGITN